MKLINGFYQSKELCPADQLYYTAARQAIKDNGIRWFIEYCELAADETKFPGKPFTLTHLQFITVLELAMEDYFYILFNPLTFNL